MRKSQIEERWRMPFIAIARALSEQGLSAKDSAKAVGMSYDEFLSNCKGRVSFDTSRRRTQVSRDHRQEFWSLLGELVEAGKNRKEAAAFLGYHPARFCNMLAENPDKNPFENSSVAIRYLRETGQTVVSAAREFSAMGLSKSEAARRIGYASVDGLGGALRARGVSFEFNSKPGPARRKEVHGVRLTRAERERMPVTEGWRALRNKERDEAMKKYERV